MKITFPHMGHVYITAKVAFGRLGVPYVMPEHGNRDALEKALKTAPEAICLPFKTILANLMEGLDRGADTVLFGGGHGRCRLSYFGDLIREILTGMGYSFHYLYMDFNHLDLREMSHTLSPLIEGRSAPCVTRALLEAGYTLFSVEDLYETACKKRCRELHAGDVDDVMRRFEQAVEKARDPGLILAELRGAKRALRAVPTDSEAKPLRVMLVGEIFTACEPFINLEIERKLGHLGVEVCNTLSVGNWVKGHFFGKFLPFLRGGDTLEAARPYTGTDDFGGFGVDTIGNAALAREKGFDGVIQIYPLTCMPEIVAQSAMPFVQEKSGIPVMTMLVDEETGEGGFITRLEAFTDMLAVRRSGRISRAG